MKLIDYFQIAPNLKVIKIESSNLRAYHYEVIDINSGISGFGSSDHMEVAQTKALYELFERTVFLKASESDNLTSSGWAAHSECDSAIRNSTYEIYERDAILVSWLLKKSPRIFKELFIPSFNCKFPVFQFGTGNQLFVQGMILDLGNKGRILVSCAADNFKDAEAKLLEDSDRAYGILESNQEFKNPVTQKHHSSFCCIDNDELKWIYAGGEGLKYSEEKIEHSIFKLPLWNREEAYVCYSKSKFLQNFYQGEASIGKINRKRLRQVSNFPFKLNRTLHPII